MFLIEGAPGTGKTTIALEFLMEGARAGEKCLYITLSETERELRQARSPTAGRSTSGSKFSNCCRQKACSIPSSSRACCIPPTSNWARPPSRFSQPSIARSRSGSCSTAFPRSGCWRRARCGTGGRFWRSNTTFANFGATVLLLDDLTSDLGDKTMHSVAHGVLRLEELAPAYGAERRRLRVIKYRGVKFRGGYHDFTIATGGRQCVSAAGVRRSIERVTPDTRYRAALPNWTSFWAMVSRLDRARWSWGRRAPANPHRHRLSCCRGRTGREGGLLRFR